MFGGAQEEEERVTHKDLVLSYRTHLASAVRAVRDVRANILTRLQEDRQKLVRFLGLDPAIPGLLACWLIYPSKGETCSAFSTSSTMGSHDKDPFYLRYVWLTCTVYGVLTFPPDISMYYVFVLSR